MKKNKILYRLTDGKIPHDTMDIIDRRKKPIQAKIELRHKEDSVVMDIRVPNDWREHIKALAKKCKVSEEFMYQKAIQGFFDLSPIIWNDDPYLNEWRQVYKLEGESALRPWIQSRDDYTTAKIIRHRDKQLKQRRKR